MPSIDGTVKNLPENFKIRCILNGSETDTIALLPKLFNCPLRNTRAEEPSTPVTSRRCLFNFLQNFFSAFCRPFLRCFFQHILCGRKNCFNPFSLFDVLFLKKLNIMFPPYNYSEVCTSEKIYLFQRYNNNVGL